GAVQARPLKWRRAGDVPALREPCLAAPSRSPPRLTSRGLVTAGRLRGAGRCGGLAVLSADASAVGRAQAAPDRLVARRQGQRPGQARGLHGAATADMDGSLTLFAAIAGPDARLRVADAAAVAQLVRLAGQHRLRGHAAPPPAASAARRRA